MCEGCMSLEVQINYDDENVFYKNVELHDTPIKKIEEGCRIHCNVAHRVSHHAHEES